MRVDPGWQEWQNDDFSGGENPLGVMADIAPNQLIVAQNVYADATGRLSSLPKIETFITGSDQPAATSIHLLYESQTSLTLLGVPTTGANADKLVYKNFNPLTVTLPLTMASFSVSGNIASGGAKYWARLGDYLFVSIQDGTSNYYRVAAVSPFTVTAYTPPAKLNSLVAYASRLWGTDGKKIYFSDLDDGTTFDPLSVVEPTLDTGDVIQRLIPADGMLWMITRLGVLPIYGTSSADIRIPLKYAHYYGSPTTVPHYHSDAGYIAYDGLRDTRNWGLLTQYHRKVVEDNIRANAGNSNLRCTFLTQLDDFIISGTGSSGFTLRHDRPKNATFSQSNGMAASFGFNDDSDFEYLYSGTDFNNANNAFYVSRKASFGTVPIVLQTRHENFGTDQLKVLRAFALELAEACNSVTVSVDKDRSGSFTTVANAQNMTAGENVIYIPDVVAKTVSVKITTSNKFVLNKMKAKVYIMTRSL